jgi:hypothetical protein
MISEQCDSCRILYIYQSKTYLVYKIEVYQSRCGKDEVEPSFEVSFSLTKTLMFLRYLRIKKSRILILSFFFQEKARMLGTVIIIFVF